MSTIAKVAVDLEANSAKFMSNLTRADAALAASGRKWERDLAAIDAKFASLGRTVGTVFAGLSGGVTVGALYAVNAEFQKLGASLKTVTGSSDAAKAALGSLEKFASETPYQLTEVTDAFIKLKAMGLDPSMDALRAYGNTASAMSKPLNQMIEAVADAATGEFERLKEFGIRASSEGDKVKFTFRGVTTTVRKNAAEIESYLRGLGEVEFAGAMAEQMATLGGQTSNLKDQFEALMRAFGEVGGNDIMSAAITGLTDTIAMAAKGVDVLAAAFGRLNRTSDEALSANKARLEEWIATLESIRDRIPKFLRPSDGSDPLLDGYIKGRKEKLAGLNAEKDRRDIAAIPRPEPRPTPAGPSDEEVKKAEAIKKQIAALQFQEAQLSRTGREQAIYAALQTAGADATARQKEQIIAAAGSLYDATQAVAAAKEAQDRLNQSEAEAWDMAMQQTEARDRIAAGMEQEIADNAKLLAALQVSEAEYERVAAMLELINQYRAAGVQMSADEIAAAEETAKKLGEQRVQMDGLKDKIESTKKLGADLGMTFSSAFEDAIVSAKSFSEVLQGLAQDILRLMIRSQITQPLAAAAQPFFSSLLGSITSGLGFASGTSSAPPGMAWVGERGPELINFRGGEQVYPAMLSKQIASAYSGLPGYADGAFSLIDGGPVGGDVKVNIINNAGDDVSAQRRTAGGGMEIDVMIDQAVSKKLGQRGGQSNKAMRQTFGAREQLVQR
ncbi:hypothetical protein A6A04_13480 [Paramagnetospirillum marisnigri]|uniref:Tape measure protein N-terminal domain-containing protein n=1 Tax=Paramagnetospirillum marisnigri TaxID=1285242 RepID=A0A178MUF3_9PROT|nr:tape measure protein [Paramagnetospirillum marisnigri]OAN53898.1 hypothetical protein A6A04_13480 [Paramagnetospirillum marisnigri]